MIRNIKDLKQLNNGRYDYSHVSGDLELPNLVEIQTKSFEEFKNKGLDDVFREAFPILNYTETLSIDYVSARFGEPEHSYLECKTQDLTYSVPIYVTLRLTHKETGEIQESEVYMGEFPLMTSGGTFIVNGVEKVIISQLVRSPGAYFSATQKAGKYLYGCDLIPGRGTWLQFESDNKDILSVRIDHQRKMNVCLLLRALGFEEDKDILQLFGKNEALQLTLEKDDTLKVKDSKNALAEIFRKMKPGEPVTEEGNITYLVQKFFDSKRNDLGRAGRYKYIKKLSVYGRLAGRILAENLVSADGEIRFTKGTLLTEKDVEDLRNEDFFET